MSYSPDSLLTSPAQGTAEWWATILAQHGADQPATIADIYYRDAPLTGLNADLALAQAVHETGWFTSPAWRERRNPAGLGITGPDVPGPVFSAPEVGIRAHLAHLCCYVYTAAGCPIMDYNTDPIQGRLCWYEPRHRFHDGKPALRDLIRPERSWAVPGTGYVDAIARIANEVVGGRPMPGPVTRVDHLPIGAPNRPSQQIIPRWVTVHETANTSVGANADAHRAYVHSGGGPQLTSYHYVVDDHETIELLPIDLAAYHAGTAEGNMSGVAIELCVNQDGDWERTKARAAELIVHLLRTVDTLDASQIVPHLHWRPTGCPARLMANGRAEWYELLAAVDDALAERDEDAILEEHYRASAAWLGEKRFAALLERDYYTGRILVCDRGVVTQTGADIMPRLMDDWQDYGFSSGTLRRL